MKFLQKVGNENMTFEFEGLDNQFKFYSLTEEVEFRFPGFFKGKDKVKYISALQFIGMELLPMCTNHELKTKNQIEDMFRHDFQAFISLVRQVLGFITQNITQSEEK